MSNARKQLSYCELFGMPNAGKSELGRWLDEKVINAQSLRYFGIRRSDSLENTLDRTAFFHKSLEMMRKSILMAQGPESILLVDRGFHDKLLLFNLLVKWKTVKESLVIRCAEIMKELSWHEVPRILIVVPIEVLIKREQGVATDPYKRWRPLLGDYVEERLKLLYSAYAAIEADEMTCILDGTSNRENIRKQAINFLEHLL